MKIKVTLLVSACSFSYGFAQTVPAVYSSLQHNYKQENYAACIKADRDVEVASTTQRDTITANRFSYLADSYYQLGNFDKAAYWFDHEMKLRQELNLTNTEDYSTVLYNLALTNLQAGRYQQAAQAADKLIVNDRNFYGVATPEFVSSVVSATDIYLQLDRFSDAEKLLTTTIAQQTKNSVDQGILYNRLADLYTVTNQFTRAEKALQKALLILEKTPGIHSAEYLSVVTNKGILFMSRGKYPEAEELFDYVLHEISTNDKGYEAVLNNQALVYQSLGRLDRAEAILNGIKTRDSISLGTSHPDFALTLTNLGLVYSDEANFEKAERTLSRALEIQKGNNEANTLSYARKLNNLARNYRMAGNADKAIPLHVQALAIFKEKLGDKSPEYATTSFNLGVAHWKAGKGSVGLKYLKNAAAIRSTKLGKRHPKTAESLQKIGEYQWEQKQFKTAHQLFGQVLDNYYYQIDRTFPVLTEEEKAKFFYTNIRPSVEKFYAFALDYKSENPAITADVYNHQVNTKAVIMYATEKVKKTILASGDTVLIKQFEEWQSQKERIAKLYGQNAESTQLDALTMQADALEKELTRKSAVFGDQFSRKRIAWQEIQRKLNDDEAAIEVVRFIVYSPEKAGAFSEKVIYAFLIITSKTNTAPEMVVLDNGVTLEGKFLNSYRNHIQYMQEDGRAYENYFKSVDAVLQKSKIKKVYFSPDGVYNQISLSTIQNPDDKKFLIDRYDIRILTNTRELVEGVSTKTTAQSSMLIGFPKFNLQREVDTTREARTRSLTRGGLTRAFRGGLLRVMHGDEGISVLPGTQREIQQIAQLTNKPQLYLEANASEESIKRIQNPTVLHVATHGYFLEEDDLVDRSGESRTNYVPNPLLKSGIILAGAENFIRSGLPLNDAGDDGILTAYEAMNLTLDNTELVVLSACETGLGVVKNGEGVYGLQRALMLAGVQNVIMSLWSVDDAATQELMSQFYLEKNKTSDLHEAFRTAQQKLKVKYPDPFYWGAFIMVGL